MVTRRPPPAGPGRPSAGTAAGFSLLEVMMGMIILSVAFVGLTSYTGAQRKTLFKSGGLSEASQIALTNMEREKVRLDDTATFLANLKQLAAGESVTKGSAAGKNGAYTIKLIKKRVTLADSLIKIQVKVTWGKTNSFTLGTLQEPP